MSLSRFDNLADTLLKGGIAPRHVRRYLAELGEHLEDLTAGQREAGYDEEDATIRARALLGSDRELAAAMLEQKQFRSWVSRAPWAVFLLLPPFATVAIGMPFIGALVLIGKYYDFLERHAPPPPLWFQTLATDVVAIANLVVTPLAAVLFVVIAARQRLKLIWPCLATGMMLVLFIHSEVSFLPRSKGHLGIGAAPIFMGAWKEMVEHWPLVSAQYFLTLTPVLWLAHRRRKPA
ncbi:MAG TPA: hypothetical protein VFI23_07705 [Rhizomicrobium sp.]|nr:hypothetical protein [Rhizomicrobium sp.]